MYHNAASFAAEVFPVGAEVCLKTLYREKRYDFFISLLFFCVFSHLGALKSHFKQAHWLFGPRAPPPGFDFQQIQILEESKWTNRKPYTRHFGGHLWRTRWPKSAKGRTYQRILTPNQKPILLQVRFIHRPRPVLHRRAYVGGVLETNITVKKLLTFPKALCYTDVGKRIE